MTVIGKVAAIYQYPVKSMLGEELNIANIETRGVAGDRVYALIDNETAKVVSVKRPKRWSRIFELQAYMAGGVWIRIPGMGDLRIDDPSLPSVLQRFFGRDVSISSSPAPDAHFDESWVRELKDGVEPYYGRASWFKDGEESVNAGASMGTQGNFFNDSPIHIVTTSTLRTLTNAAPNSRFEPQRFRPNILIDTSGLGFIETSWQSLIMAIGSVRLSVTFTVPRCVMMTLAQGNLPPDPNVLRTITTHIPLIPFQLEHAIHVLVATLKYCSPVRCVLTMM